MDSQGISDENKEAILDCFTNNLPMATADLAEGTPDVNCAYDAKFYGWQPTGKGHSVPLYNVNKPGHPYHNSTVSIQTLDREGLTYPPPPNEGQQ